MVARQMVVIALLRGVNVGGHNRIKMDVLKSLCAGLGLCDIRTYIQSGNIVFTTKEKSLAKLAIRIEDSIENKAGFRPSVILRTAAELEDVIAKSPFAAREGIESNKLYVTFVASEPTAEACSKVLAIKADPEELHIVGRELYIYFPDGMGRTKLPLAAIDRALKVAATARNWNTVTKLVEMATASHR
jgi:uncharacterized protein (DUF1697 family)